MAQESYPFTHPVNAAKVIDKDLDLVVEPAEADRKAIAKAYDVDSIEALKAALVLKPYRKAGIRVVGTLEVSMVRTCVVSLEPFESVLKLDIDRTFEPHSSRPRKIKDLNEDGEIEIDLESLDPPDVILDGVLDLGAVICEEFALSLDPFPRKPGIEFEGGAEEETELAKEEEGKQSPFSALKALKGEADS